MQKEQKNFSTFDTVEILFPDIKGTEYKFRGYLLQCSIDENSKKGLYDSVFIGHYKKYHHQYVGNNVIIQTTRMVLIEKFDSKVLASIFLTLPILHFVKKK